jgi:putative cardiolipin synthase
MATLNGNPHANRSPAVRPLIAVLALFVTLVLGACSSLPKDFERPVSHAVAPAQGTHLWTDLEPLIKRHPEQSGFHTLSEGEEAFIARLRLIQSAEKSIDLQYYIWHDDLTGRTLHNQLLEAADRGVRVRMLLDDLDTAGKDHILRLIDAHPMVEIRLFNPFANRKRRIADLAGDTRRINRRMHNKTMTADSLVTIFGGRNIGDEYFAAATDVGFGDMDALAIGPIAAEVAEQFDLYWNSQWAYPITAFNWDAPVEEQEVARFREHSDTYLAQAMESSYAEVVRQFNLSRVENISDLDFVWSRWLLAYDHPSKVTAKKVSANTHLAPKLKEGMDKTLHDLVIVSPYFVPGDTFTAYLADMVERGVRVRVLTNSLESNDVSLVHAGYMRYRKALISGGVELYEFKASANKLDPPEQRTRIGASKASLHAKFFGFDQTYLFIGSYNLDGRSTTLNSELGAYFESPEQAAQLSREFDQKAIQIAYRVELDASRKLKWTTLEGGDTRQFHEEPGTTWWKRFNTRLLSFIVPESQL